MSSTLVTAGRTVALVLAAGLGGLMLLLSVGGAIPSVLNSYDGNWNGQADLITPRIPFVEGWDELDKDSGDAYAGVLISSPEALAGPRALQAVDAGITSLVAIIGSLLVLLIAVRLLRRRRFSRLARWGLAALGGLLMLSAAVGPQLRALSSDLAVQELGYPVVPPDWDGVMTEQSPELIALTLWDPIWTLARVDLTLFLVGAVIAVLGFLVADGVRLQRDTEGLV